MSRFPALYPEQMTPAQREVHDAIASGPRGGVRGPFLALLHNPELAMHIQALGEYLRFKTRIPQPLMEIAILVTARHWTAQYEWYAHAKLAAKAGVAQATIDAIARNAKPSGLTADEALVHAFAEQVLKLGAPDDAMFAAARDRFGLDGVLDLVALCGYYTTIGLVLNAAQVPVPEGPPPLARP